MKVLVVGSGGREHAIIKALAGSCVYCFATHANPGIIQLVADYQIGAMDDAQSIVNFATSTLVDWAIIGPEAALAAGVSDALIDHGIPTIGPRQQLANIETSKGFARDLLSQAKLAGIPPYRRFAQLDNEAIDYIRCLNNQYVIKDDGLCGGKGVKVAGEHLNCEQEALDFCRQIAGPFVVEQKLQGPEFSLMSFTDGITCAHMPPIQDHKRAFAGDAGPNTGGMGSYSAADHQLPFLTNDDIAKAQALNEATVALLAQQSGELYQGILYGGFIKTKQGVMLIEYNARFGDPEAINALALLTTDLATICQAIINKKLDQVKVEFQKRASVCKYIVPEGYPGKIGSHNSIDVSAITNQNNLYIGAVIADQGKYIMTGSRAAAVLGLGSNIEQAEQQAELLALQIKGQVRHRSDIGTEQLINNKMALL